MKQIFRVLKAIGLAAILLCLTQITVFAQETDETNQFPEGVIEVPEGTAIEIDDDAGTVTIQDCPVKIASGDTFVVYLQDLPIGYVAENVAKQDDNSIVISAQKAEKEVYELLDEEGDIALTPDMYEFVPAPNVTYSQSAESPISTQSLDYKDGTLSMGVSMGGANANVSVSNLHLYHSVNNGDITVTLSGDWKIGTTLSVEDDELAEVPLGEIRIAGVGKIGISLSFNQSASIKCDLSGTFSTGVTIDQNGTGTASKGFSLSNRSVEGQGSISASLKFTAGVDILVAAADLYAEVGAKTQYTAKDTFYDDPPRTVHCDDFRYYLYANVGVEAKYYSIASGGMKPLASKKLLGSDEKDTPYIINNHFENGKRVGSCSQGMEVRDLFFGGFNAGFTGTILTDKRDRILETDFNLPWDTTVEQDLHLTQGTLNLNGRTLTIKGNLIQSGGTLEVGNGTLIVEGDYRIQSVKDGQYGDSTGSLIMNNSDGTIDINGNFVIQTNSLLNYIYSGTINLGGDFYQKNAVGNKVNFNSGYSLNLVLTEDKSHRIDFEESEKNRIGHLTLKNDVTIQSAIHLGTLDSNGHSMVVEGNMFSDDNVDLNGGTLKVKGSLYHWYGKMFLNRGKIEIAENYYCMGSDSDLTPGKETITDAGAYLEMIYNTDEMRVGGDFLIKSGTPYGDLTAGTLYVGGDFTQLEGRNDGFEPTEGHKTVLNGTGKQTVSFEDDWHGFGTLEVTNTQLVFEKNVNWKKQVSDIHAVSNGSKIDGDKVNLNGYELTIDGNVGVCSNTIDVNNGIMTVNGSLNHYNGGINLNGGKLYITDNYYCVGDDSNFTPGKETFTSSLAYLKMNYAADEMRVDGDFLTKSCETSTTLTAGTLYVGGNFTQLGESLRGFEPTEGHRTVLDGTEKQTISFENDSYGFGTLEATNDQLVFEKNISWMKQGSNIHAVSNGSKINGNDINLNGHELTIDGDIEVDSYIDINSGVMTVNGSLNHYYDEIKLNGGKLEITGNYHCIGKDSNLTSGKETITKSSAGIVMVYAADEMRVAGDFLIKNDSRYGRIDAGTLYVGGDFKELNKDGDNFAHPADHKTVLNGNDKQTISFESEYSGFGTLGATNDQLVFEKNVSWREQESDIHAVSNGAKINGVHIDMNMNGHTLAIDGDIGVCSDINMNGGAMIVNGSMNHYNDKINLNGGKLQITGNYRCVGAGSDFTPGKEIIKDCEAYLNMNHSTDEMRVDGDFLIKSNISYGDLTAGTLYIGGDFTQLNGNVYNFAPTEGHRTVFNGSGEQTISFESEKAGFGTLETTNNQLEFTKNVGWKKQGSDIHAVSNGSKINRGETDLNGYELTIDGDIGVYRSVDINNGTMTVNGSMDHYDGEIKLNCGKLYITDNYYCVGDNSNFTPGKEKITECSADIEMIYAADEMRVGGDFLTKSSVSYGDLTAGTLYVGGDFTQLNGYASNFVPTVDHKTVLNGSGKQTIHFESEYAGFGTLELTKSKSQYTFNREPCWVNLIANAAPMKVDSGYSGDLTWELNDEGVLTFSGTGLMKNYTSKTAMPWYKYADQITSVVIENGVTRIGDNAFYGISMTSIEIPDTVTVIGDYAFKSAAALKEVVLPAKLTKLGESAFYGCTSLESIDIPASLYTVKPYTFKNCTALSSVTFHEGNLMKLSDGAFYGTALTEVTFPACLNIIDSYCFKNCDKLASIVIPEGKLTEIREAVFYGTAASELTIPEGIKKVGAYAFKNCINLTTINLPDSLTSVGEASFYACTGLQNITIPDHVTTIGNYAFRRCTGLTEAIFGNELAEIGESAFYGCSGLTNLNLNNVTTLGGYAFKSCIGLTSVELGKVETIGESAFHSCTGLENITFPTSVTSIGDYCFSGSTKLSQMQFEGDAPKIGTNAFRGLTVNVTYPAEREGWTSDVMQSYGGNITWTALAAEKPDAENDDSENSDIEDPATEEPVADPTEGTCGEGLSWKQDGDELIISGSGKLDDCIWENGNEIQRVVIERDVTFIGDHAFDGLDALTEIIFKGNAPEISTNAFAGRTLIVKYPSKDISWTDDIFQNYNGNITWCAVDENGSLIEQAEEEFVSEEAVSEQSILEENSEEESVVEETVSESTETVE